MLKISRSGSEYFVNMFKQKKASYELRETMTSLSPHAPVSII